MSDTVNTGEDVVSTITPEAHAAANPSAPVADLDTVTRAEVNTTPVTNDTTERESRQMDELRSLNKDLQRQLDVLKNQNRELVNASARAEGVKTLSDQTEKFTPGYVMTEEDVATVAGIAQLAMVMNEHSLKQEQIIQRYSNDFNVSRNLLRDSVNTIRAASQSSPIDAAYDPAAGQQARYAMSEQIKNAQGLGGVLKVLMKFVPLFL